VRDEASDAASPDRIAAAYLERAADEIGIDGFALRPMPERRTRLGAWVPFSLERDGPPILDAVVSVHVDLTGRVDRVAGHTASRRLIGELRLDAYDALLAAVGAGPRFGLLDPSVERAPGAVARALFDTGASLRPVFVVYPRSQHPLERYQVVVDGLTGAVLSSHNRVVFESDYACGNVFDPTPGGTLEPGDAVETVLPYAWADEDGHLKGSYIEIFNCCTRVGCDDYAEESREQGSVANPIGIGADPIYFDIVSCDEHPKATASDGRFLYEPIDPPPGHPDYDLALADDFAETAVYWTAQGLLTYIRQIGDPDFLLRSHGGTPEAPARGFHTAVNMVVPDFQQAYDQIIPAPFGPGRGSEDNPLVINEYMRIANAAYVPALTPGTQPLPIEIFNRDFDSVIMFQGEVRDFGYDGDIVYHEMTHAVVGSTAELGMHALDEQGSLASPGALNEGYADYFAASLSNDSVTGEYGAHTAGEEGGIRDAENERICPDHLTGEVHDDSWPWSGALWDLRNIFVAPDCERERFDAAIYDAMVGLPPRATFDDASEATALALAQTYGRDGGAYQIARCIFEQRGMLGCERVVRILTVDDQGGTSSSRWPILNIPSAGEVGASAAPSQLQFRVDVPKGTTHIVFSWQEGAGGMDAYFGGSATFDVLYRRGSPIRYDVSGATITSNADAEVTVTRTPGNITTPGSVDPVELEVQEPCGASYYFAFINPGGGAMAGDITATANRDEALAATCTGPLDVSPEPAPPAPASCESLPVQIGDSEQCAFAPHQELVPCPPEPEEEEEPVTDEGCDCSAASPTGNVGAALLLALAALTRRRRR